MSFLVNPYISFGGGGAIEDQANRTLLTYETFSAGDFPASGNNLDAYHQDDTDFLFDRIGPAVQVDTSTTPFTSLGYTRSFHQNHFNLDRGLLTANTQASLPDRIKLAGATDWTVEWYGASGSSNNDNPVCGFWGNATGETEWLVSYNGFERASFHYWNGSSLLFNVNSSVVSTLATWEHYALCLSGGTIQGWLNGTRVINTASPGVVNRVTTAKFSVGCLFTTGSSVGSSYYPTTGSGIRLGPIHIWKGNAKYDGATITPDFPTNPFA